MTEPSALFRLLGDETRLRLLRLLDRDRLNVTELVTILGQAQSGVSRHLRLLREGGLLDEQRQAGWAWFRLRDGVVPAGVLAEIRAAGGPGDDARLADVLRLRRDREPGGEGSGVPGRSWAAWARALGLLLPRVRVADLGCGEGRLAAEAAAWAASVTGVDRSPARIARARELASRRGLRNVKFLEGPLEKLPLRDQAYDVALLAQVLHAVPDPARVLAEARRILKPGGRLLVLELKPHKETWVRERLGHVALGFDRVQLGTLLESAGFLRLRIRPGDGRRGDPFGVVIAVADRPRLKAKKGGRP